MKRTVAALSAVVLGAGLSAAAHAAPGPHHGPGATAHQAPRLVTVAHAPSGFTARAPRGYRLRVAGGQYRITGGRVSVTVRVVRTTRAARAVGQALVRRGDRVTLRTGTARVFRLVGLGRGQRRAVTVQRRGADLVVTTRISPRGNAGAARVADAIGRSVRGGTPGARRRAAGPGTPPGPTTPGGPVAPGVPPGRIVPLVRFRAPDGGATAWVPADGDWVVNSSQGALEGSSPRGNFLLGQSFNIILPEGALPGLPPTAVVHPYVNAAQALERVWPLINRGVGIDMTDVRVRELVADATLPSFQSSGMMVFDYRIGGVPFVGLANIATESRLSSSGTFFWQLYISVIGVPAAGDPQVGAALRLVWRSWNPSGAIAARTQASQRLLEETNQIWREVAEFRSLTADQQSRDVSCLLGTGPFIDDNARELGLPPLRDCESIFVRVRD